MNKQELVKIVAEKSEVSQKVAASVLDSALETIMDVVAKNDKVQIVGFGTFESKHREARTGRNPRTKEEVQIPATTVPAFKAGKAFKDKVDAQ